VTLRERLSRHDPTLTIPASVSVAEQPAGVRIAEVAEGSLAEKAGILVGEKLLRVNGKGIRDTVDFYFHGSDDRLRLDMEDAAGKPRRVSIRKTSPEQHLGIEIEQFVTQNCGCNCVFCFVHQLPDNLRRTLYVKDEDYRHSFLNGSYITGVTLKQSDLDRIAEQRLTPLYISIHAIDEELRRWLLGIKKALPALEMLAFFRKHRITVHTQIVLCPGKNDGAQLERTLAELARNHPTVASIAVVPLGMTKWREGLPDLQPITKEYAAKFIREWRPKLREMESKYGHPVAMLADEWFLIAGMRTPAYTLYPELPQLSNGVGVVYHFYKDFGKARRALPKSLGRKWRVAAITSTLSGPALERIATLCRKCEGLEIDIIPTVNTLFGESIHVTGLLGGGDIGKTIKHNPFYDQYLLPGNCLRKQDERFIDDVLLSELRARTGKLVSPVLGGAHDFVQTIVDAATGHEHRAPEGHVFLEKHWSNS